MKKILKKISFSLFVGTISVFLVTTGIDAVDNYDHFSESVLGKIFSSKQGPCPPDMTFVSTDTGGFCVDLYEASLSSSCPIQSPSSVKDSQRNIDYADCKFLSKPDAKPWTFISQNQAVRACAKMGKRLPTNKEWSLASLGTPDISQHWEKTDCQVAKNWKNQPGLTGSGESCYSYAGAYDMIGNVWEWVTESLQNGKINNRELPTAGYVKEINENDGLPSKTSSNADEIYYDDYLWIKPSETRGVARGGYWNNEKEAGQYAVYAVLSPSSVGNAIGFRCVK